MSSAATIYVSGDKAVAARLARLRAGLGPMVGTALTAAAQPCVNRAKQRAPYLTGNLRRSIHFSLTSVSRIGAAGLVGTNVVYARIQELGGTIEAKNGGYLRFRTADGAWHAVKQVTIPPHPYMRPAADETPAAVVATFSRAFGALVARAA